MSLLEIKDLSHSFGETVLYKNASLALNKGEHMGIVGQNGCGKSTLIKILTEQIIPDTGQVLWHLAYRWDTWINMPRFTVPGRYMNSFSPPSGNCTS